MKQDNINYLLVGSFVIATGLMFFVLLYSITGRIADADQYFTVLDDVTGVNEGSSVIYNGYKIGQISSIEPVYKNDKTRFELSLMVKSGWKISRGSKAMISSKGLLSDAQVSIKEGSVSGVLSPGEYITGTASTNIMMVVKSLGQQINTLSTDLIIPLVKQIKDDMSMFSKNMNSEIPRLTANLNELVLKLQKNSEAIDSLFARENTKNITTVLTDAKVMMKNLKSASLSVGEIVEGNKSGVNDSVIQLNAAIVSFNSKLNIIMNQLERGSRNINNFSNQIKNNPAVILKNKPQSDPALR